MRVRLQLLCLSVIANAIPAPKIGRTLSDNTVPQNNTRSASICQGNTANDRTKWCEDSIDTDWYNYVPNTGVTREVRCYRKDIGAMLTNSQYWLDITNMTIAPDGFERVALGVNNSIPGPTIEANWVSWLHQTSQADLMGLREIPSKFM